MSAQLNTLTQNKNPTEKPIYTINNIILTSSQDELRIMSSQGEKKT